jgi:hypothetical protein
MAHLARLRSIQVISKLESYQSKFFGKHLNFYEKSKTEAAAHPLLPRVGLVAWQPHNPSNGRVPGIAEISIQLRRSCSADERPAGKVVALAPASSG